MEQTPALPAVVFRGEETAYLDLDWRSSQLAHTLIARGIGPEDLVGICLERSPELIVGILGILKAGAAYLPLDPEYPRERLAFMLRDAGARLVLTREELAPLLPAPLPEGCVALHLDTGWEGDRRRSRRAARRCAGAPATPPASSTPPARPASPRGWCSPTATW